MSADTRTTWEGTVDCPRCRGDVDASFAEQDWTLSGCDCEPYTDDERAEIIASAERRKECEWNDPDRMTGGF